MVFDQKPPQSKPTCWIIVDDGKAGTENICLGLAEAMGVQPTLKRIRLRWPWRWLSPFISWGMRWAFSSSADQIYEPWPDILITSGRSSVLASLYIKRASRRKTFTVQILDPQVSPLRFDMVIVPEHDRLRGPNVLLTRGALHRVTPEKLKQAAEEFAPPLAHLPHPRLAVLIGGTNKVYTLTPALIDQLAESLITLAQKEKAGLMVTTSRRTGKENENRLRQCLEKSRISYTMWDGTGKNPYFAYLGLADGIVVTGDSVSMPSEACSTGKPVFLFNLEGGSAKFRRFHENLFKSGAARPFTGVWETWTYTPFCDTERMAAEVWKRYRAHNKSDI